MKTLKSLLLVAVLLITTAFTVKETISKGYKVGDIAEDFSLKNVNGKMVSMSDYKEAKGYVVIFTCNHCPYSKMYEDRIIALDKKYKEKGYPVIAINPNDPAVSPGDDFDGMVTRAKYKGFTFPYLFDEGQKVYPKYGATKTPHVFLLNKEKEGLRVAYIGAIDNNARNAAKANKHYVADAIEALLTNKEVTTKSTKAIGCSIKREL